MFEKKVKETRTLQRKKLRKLRKRRESLELFWYRFY